MADPTLIRPKDLPSAASVSADSYVVVDNGLTVEKGTVAQAVEGARPLASQAEAAEGANNTKMMTPLRVKQAIDALGNRAKYETKDALAEAGSVATAGDQAFLTDETAAGSFVYNDSDLSAEVTDDPARALYVAQSGDPTGASGAWVRQYDGPAFYDWTGGANAAALGKLATSAGRLSLQADQTVETAPFIQRNNFTLDGGSGTITNTNTTPLGDDDTPSATMFLGTSNLLDSDALTYYAVSAVSGMVLTSTGNGGNFPIGKNIVMRGATKYTAGSFDVYRNTWRAIVIAQTDDTITIDRVPPAELIADSPEVAVAESDTSAFTGAPGYYLLARPRIYNQSFASVTGTIFTGGGVIDGVIRDVVTVGRNGLALNAMQDCLIDGLHFRAWRKMVELAEGSYGTTVCNVRGTLDDYTLHSDIGAAPFFIAMNENCAECVYEKFVVSSGVNIASGNACNMGAGRDNEIRNSTFRFPAHTGVALALQSNATAGNGLLRCGYRNVKVIAPVCSFFLSVGDAGGGVDEPYVIDCSFRGTPTTRAANLIGTNGKLLRNRFESGNISCTGTMTGWRIEDNYIPGTFAFPATFTNNKVVGNYIGGGFTNLTAALLESNDIRDNESDESRAFKTAAYAPDATPITVSSTTANNVFAAATFEKTQAR